MDFALRVVNWSVGLAYIFCLSYQAVFLFAPWFRKKRDERPVKAHDYAVLISARNEESVIAQLIGSIMRQTYKDGKVDVYVVADNCTDRTASCAREAGAYVIERFNKNQIGKGYALDYLVSHLQAAGLFAQYDGYIVFDADNLLKENYIEEINQAFSQGYPVVTSYRNSKNFADNWISCDSGLWFLHDAQFSNRSRMLTGSNCMINGTGFLVSREMLEEAGGWKFFLMTEDIEFNAYCILHHHRIGYCESAIFYDEQPDLASDSWKQRLRWVKGYFQVLRCYGGRLVKAVFRKDGFAFSAYDMLMSSLPSFIILIAAVVLYVAFLIAELATGQPIGFAVFSIVRFFVIVTVVMFLLGIYTMAAEWKKVPVSGAKKMFYCLMFPVYMEMFIPIAIQALFKKVEWEQIHHSAVELPDASQERHAS